MLPESPVLELMEYELMLFSRYYLRPQHRAEGMLDRSAFVLLSRMENVLPMTLKELAVTLRLDGSTVHRQVGALLRPELLAYAPHDGGELARRVTPTAAGRAALRECRKVYAEGIGQVISDWSEAKSEQFLKLLKDFNQGVEALEGSPWPRK